MKYKIVGTFVGIPRPVGNMESSILKRAVDVLELRFHGIKGDEVANDKHHGGDMRVIHHYSTVNYNHLKKTFPDIADRFQPGTFGENIVTEELTETDLFIGDIYRLGTARVQLTVSRRPCATINAGYNDSRVLKEVMQTGRTGWFYRVLEEGEVRVGDTLEFLERPYPDLRVSDLYDQGYKEPRFADKDLLKRCMATGLMDKGWMPKLESALSH